MNDLAFLGSALPVGWESVTIEDVTSKVGSGATPRGGSSVYIESGTAFIRSQNVYDHEFRVDGIVRITYEAADQLRGVTVEQGDVLINITGDSILRTCLVPQDLGPARVSQHVAIVRSNGRVQPGFLQKWLALPAMKEFMIGHSSGGTRKAVTKGHLLSFPVPLPPLNEQESIAATLGVLDEKIQSNRRANELILSLADALYAEACDGSGVTRKVGDIAAFHNRRRIPLSSAERDARVGPYPYYGATGVFGFVDDYLFDEILVLVGEDGSVVNDDGSPVTQYIWGRAWVNNHAHPLTGISISNELLLLALRGSDVRPIVTGAVQPKISMGNLKSLDVLLPGSARQVTLERELDALFAEYRSGADETAVLVTLRDALLPELLSGRIRVREGSEAEA